MNEVPGQHALDREDGRRDLAGIRPFDRISRFVVPEIRKLREWKSKPA
jgi:hypothetical protein